MALTSGTRLGPYEILAPIGAGGMGEVYKATDTRLDRTVAIKVLPEHLAESPERKARFEREAKAISQLNHPHICTLHDVGEQDGIDFIVMEYIEGETLAERLKKGALPLDKALEYGIQIADGLDTAHRAGIVHRDLKPANAMLTKSGIKLLDFGLARLVEGDVGPETSEGPTQQRDLTKERSIIGTLQYMAPEQLEGRTADARTDIFALGVVLYEMVTGQKAFDGESQGSLMTAILRDPPAPISTKALDRIVQRCLAKNPDNRWQSAADVGSLLTDVASAEETSLAEASPRAARLPWLFAGGFAAVAGFALLFSDETGPPPTVTRLTANVPAEHRFLGNMTRRSNIAISPDGRHIVYASQEGASTLLYRRSLGDFEAIPIEGAAESYAPFFSPDGAWLGFVTRGRSISKMPWPNGRPQTVCDTCAREGQSPKGFAWTEDERIVYQPMESAIGQTGGLSVVAAEGGTPRSLTRLGDGERTHVFPQALPAGNRLLFTVVGDDGVARPAILSLDTERWEVVDFEAGSVFHYVPTGHLAYQFGDQLMMVPFDVARADIVGSPVPVLGGILPATSGYSGNFAVSRAGTLVYLPRSGFGLVRVARGGQKTPVTEERLLFEHPRLSSDGTRLAIDIEEGDVRSIWIYDLARGSRLRLSSQTFLRVWSPDARSVFYTLAPAGSEGPDLFQRNADGSGDVVQIELPGDEASFEAMSSDGSFLVLRRPLPGSPSEEIVVWDRKVESSVLVTRPTGPGCCALSPDDRYVAYTLNDSGNLEVSVVQIDGGARWPVSTDGGSEPYWSSNGREIYYRRQGDNGITQVLAVPVQLEPSFEAGDPVVLFDGPYDLAAGGDHHYAASPDGQWFIMVDEDREAPTEIRVVLNWFQELEHLVPTNK